MREKIFEGFLLAFRMVLGIESDLHGLQILDALLMLQSAQDWLFLFNKVYSLKYRVFGCLKKTLKFLEKILDFTALM